MRLLIDNKLESRTYKGFRSCEDDKKSLEDEEQLQTLHVGGVTMLMILRCRALIADLEVDEDRWKFEGSLKGEVSNCELI
jgi:hypothetical protein